MWHKVMIAGHLGRDPVLRYLGNGTAVCDFSLASGRKYTKADGTEVDETIWFAVTVWGDQAENCHKYLAKGRPVLVESRLRPDEKGNPKVFQKQDGSAGARYEITATDVRFLSTGGGQQQPGLVVDETSYISDPDEEFAF